MNTNLSLDSVLNQFTNWRSTRKGGSRTPESLQRQAVELKSHYPVSQIVKTLGISHSNLKAWSVDYSQENIEQVDFMNLPVETQLPSTTPAVRFEFPNGIGLMLAPEQLTQTLLSSLYQIDRAGSD